MGYEGQTISANDGRGALTWAVLAMNGRTLGLAMTGPDWLIHPSSDDNHWEWEEASELEKAKDEPERHAWEQETTA